LPSWAAAVLAVTDTTAHCPAFTETRSQRYCPNLLIFHNVVTMTKALQALMADGVEIDESEPLPE
jgi:hypothetical protein